MEFPHWRNNTQIKWSLFCNYISKALLVTWSSDKDLFFLFSFYYVLWQFIFLIFILLCPMAIYFSYFHSIMSYGIIFWGSSSENNSIFTTQTSTIRVIVNSSSGTFCHKLFKELQILTLLQCIYSLTMFDINNRQLFKSISDDHNLSTRYNSDFYLPTANLTFFFYFGNYNVQSSPTDSQRAITFC